MEFKSSWSTRATLGFTSSNKRGIEIHYKIDGSGHMLEWAQWLIGGALVVGAIALTICTAGLGTAIAGAIGTGVWTAVAGGAIDGTLVGAASGDLVSAGTQIFTNGFDNFSWKDVGIGALTGGIAGGIAGGLFAGIQYGLSAGKIANGISGLSKGQARLDNVMKPLGSLNNMSKLPFGGANIARTVGQVAGNYNSAYSAYMLAKGTYSIVEVGTKVIYFGLENLASDFIGMGLGLLF